MIEMLTLIACVLLAVFAAFALRESRKHPRMPHWLQYDRNRDVLIIHGRKYAADLFGNAGFLGPVGSLLRVESGPDNVVTVGKVQSLPVNDNSVFVLTVSDQHLTTEQYKFLKESLHRYLGSKHKVLVLDKDLSLTVI